jgi:broad specificity phosphatase PhoE
MLRIVFIRPGRTDYDEQGRISGSLDIPLNAEGIREVQAMIPQLQRQQIEVIYASACEPALQSATILAEALDVRLKKLDRMCNLNHGLWQGMSIDEVKHKQPKVYRQWQEQAESVCPPEGETVAEARERAEAAMSKVLRKHKQGTIAVVLPEPLASITRSALCKVALGDLWHAGCERAPCDVVELESAAPAGPITYRIAAVETKTA